jgi:hypothetical protein
MYREEETQEHEQKINKYQAILAARLKAKYFSNTTFDGGIYSSSFASQPDMNNSKSYRRNLNFPTKDHILSFNKN